MGRAALPGRILLKLPDGMKESIVAARDPGEDTATFIRQAIEREIARRKRKAKP